MDVFNLRDRVVDDYGRYVQSFLTIKDEYIQRLRPAGASASPPSEKLSTLPGSPGAVQRGCGGRLGASWVDASGQGP